MQHQPRFTMQLVVVAASAMLVVACGPRSQAVTSHPKPATVEKISGSNVSRVTLTEEGAKRIDLRTDTIGAQDGRPAIPYGAIVYDASGTAWAYTATEPLTFVRQQISVDAIKSGVAVLKDGPPIGTRVVTLGAAELYGVEFGVGH